MLIVGVNSYVDINEAKEIMSRLPKSEPNRVTWDNLDDEEKEALIYNATLNYDTDEMLYKGVKADKEQIMQFPRKDLFGRITECPEKIKLGLILQGTKEVQAYCSQEMQLRENGVHSFSDGSGASVTFESNSNANTKNNLGLYKDIWNKYFKPYTLIC